MSSCCNENMALYAEKDLLKMKKWSTFKVINQLDSMLEIERNLSILAKKTILPF